MLNNLIQQKFTLEAAEETTDVYETLTLASSTNKELLSNESFSVEEMKSEMDQQE